MPCSIVEPVPEFVEAVGDKVFRCAEVEPGIDYNWRSATIRGGLVQGVGHQFELTFVDDTLESCWKLQLASSHS